jgi:hypothetical protein
LPAARRRVAEKAFAKHAGALSPEEKAQAIKKCREKNRAEKSAAKLFR